MLFDLHTHTKYSDGSLTPKELMELAKSKGIELLAITDHDRVGAFDEAIDISHQLGIKLVCGIEISTPEHRHIVGMCINRHHESIQRVIDFNKEQVKNKIEHIGNSLAKLGHPEALSEVLKRAPEGGSINSYNFAKYLEDKGAVPVGQGYEVFFKEGGLVPRHKTNWISIEDAVLAIKEAGGIPTMAHLWRYFNKDLPGNETPEKRQVKMHELLTRFVAAGGEAMEVDGSKLDDWSLGFLAEMATEFNLYVSAGSDFHNIVKNKDFGRAFTLPSNHKVIWEHPKFEVL